MIKLGITGNLGSGKSLAVAYLADMGAAVIDADIIGHQIILCGRKAYDQLIDTFGDCFLNADGELDRRKLGMYIFSDFSGEKRQLLNAITHPLITEEIQKQLNDFEKQGYQVTVVEAAVLLESDIKKIMDKIWLISCPRKKLYDQIRKQGIFSEAEAKKRLFFQMSEAEMKTFVDLVIVNNSTPEHLRKKIKYEFNKLIKDLS